MVIIKTPTAWRKYDKSFLGGEELSFKVSMIFSCTMSTIHLKIMRSTKEER